MCSGSAVDQLLLQNSSSEPAGGAAEGGGLERLRSPPDGGGGSGGGGRGEQRNSGRNPGCPAASTDQVRISVWVDYSLCGDDTSSHKVNYSSLGWRLFVVGVKWLYINVMSSKVMKVCVCAAGTHGSIVRQWSWCLRGLSCRSVKFFFLWWKHFVVFHENTHQWTLKAE